MACPSTTTATSSSSSLPAKRLSFPYDVWINIAHCIPPLELEELFSVNSALFHLSMEQRYRQISFSYWSSRMLRLLVRLKDPDVAKRVRILHIHPHFIKEVIASQTSSSASDSLFSTLFTKHGKKLLRRPKSRKARPKTLDEVVLLMTDILGGLPNLSEYHIAWVGLPAMPAPFICTPFISSPITKLSLEMTLENLSTLLHPRQPCLCEPKELDLFLRTDHRLDRAGYDMILADILAPLLNIHRFETLTLRLWEPIDLSPLLSSLHRLPNLHTLSLTVPLTSPHLGDPDALASFINLHTSTLTTLRMRASDLSSPMLGMLDGKTLSRWIKSAFQTVQVDALRTFELGMALVPYESALLCLSRFTGQLERLTLTGRPLSYGEVKGLLGGVGCLRRLRVGPVILSPELVDVFAESDVERLEVVVGDVVPCEADTPIHSPGFGQDASQVARFAEAMEGKLYERWRLTRLELVLLGSRSLPDEEMEGIWRRCVPGLRYVTM